MLKLWKRVCQYLIRGTALFIVFLGMAMADKPDLPDLKGVIESPATASSTSKAEADRKTIMEKMHPPPQALDAKTKVRASCQDSRGVLFRDGDPGYVGCLEEMRREQRMVSPINPPVGYGPPGVGVQIQVR